MNHSDAGKLGSAASAATLHAAKKERMDAYYANPSLCNVCRNVIPYHKKKNRFCGWSCGAKLNNRLRVRRAAEKTCVSCGKHFFGKRENLCSRECVAKRRHDLWKEKISNDNCVTGIDAARKYLREVRGKICENCGITTWCDKPVPLCVDHIDGNPYNWCLDNLRLLCLNCDGQTPTFKAKNKGNGRHARMQRYNEGKSY